MIDSLLNSIPTPTLAPIKLCLVHSRVVVLKYTSGYDLPHSNLPTYHFISNRSQIATEIQPSLSFPSQCLSPPVHPLSLGFFAVLETHQAFPAPWTYSSFCSLPDSLRRNTLVSVNPTSSDFPWPLELKSRFLSCLPYTLYHLITLCGFILFTDFFIVYPPLLDDKILEDRDCLFFIHFCIRHLAKYLAYSRNPVKYLVID